MAHEMLAFLLCTSFLLATLYQSTASNVVQNLINHIEDIESSLLLIKKQLQEDFLNAVSNENDTGDTIQIGMTSAYLDVRVTFKSFSDLRQLICHLANDTITQIEEESLCNQANKIAAAVLHHQSTFSSTARHLSCQRPWPQLSIFVPVKLTFNRREPQRFYEHEMVFLRTFLFFWPLEYSNTSLILGIDGELDGSKTRKMVEETLLGVAHRVPAGAKVVSLPSTDYYTGGYNRQQWSIFWGDNFTDTEYIGFCDTDTVFITSVDREDIFEEGKPVINAISGYNPVDSVITSWANGTFVTLGVKEPFLCMAYFPVVIKTSHLKALREHISHLHKMSFDDVFREKIQAQPYSQFNIMCTYLYLFKRNEYVWYTPSQSPDWDGKTPTPREFQDGNLKQFTAEMLVSKPRVAVHAGYRPLNDSRFRDLRCENQLNINHRINLNLLMQQGVCIDPRFMGTKGVCANASIHTDGYFFEMHAFDGVDLGKLQDKERLQLQFRRRYQRLRKCHVHHWDPEELKRIMKPEECMVASKGYDCCCSPLTYSNTMPVSKRKQRNSQLMLM